MSVSPAVHLDVSLSSSVNDLWRDCHALGNEMIVTSTGRRIFPTLEFNVTGLDPTKYYTCCLYIELVDGRKLRFNAGDWIENASSEEVVVPRKVWHINGSVRGSEWMARPFTFDRVRITNKKSKEEGNSSYIFLHTQHRYQPVVSFYECTSDIGASPQLVASTRIAHSQFITVTAYHKEEINTLKTNNNPYSTGSRKDRRRERRASSVSSEESSHSDSSISPPLEKKIKLEESDPSTSLDPCTFQKSNFAMFQAYYHLFSQMTPFGQFPLPFGHFPFMSSITPPSQSPTQTFDNIKMEPTDA